MSHIILIHHLFGSENQDYNSQVKFTCWLITSRERINLLWVSRTVAMKCRHRMALLWNNVVFLGYKSLVTCQIWLWMAKDDFRIEIVDVQTQTWRCGRYFHTIFEIISALKFYKHDHQDFRAFNMFVIPICAVPSCTWFWRSTSYLSVGVRWVQQTDGLSQLSHSFQSSREWGRRKLPISKRKEWRISSTCYLSSRWNCNSNIFNNLILSSKITAYPHILLPLAPTACTYRVIWLLFHDDVIKFFALLAICAGNSRVCGEFPTQRPMMQSFDVFFELRLNRRLSKQWWGW